MLKKEVSQDDIEKMVTDKDVKVSKTELSGEVVSSYTLQEFVVGKTIIGLFILLTILENCDINK